VTTSRQRQELGLLLFVANRALEQRAFDAVAAAGITDITLAQARIAARIAPDGSRVSDLAEQARVTKQSAAALVEQLEKAEYVERVPDPTDGRARLVRLTPRLQRVAEVADARSRECSPSGRTTSGRIGSISCTRLCATCAGSPTRGGTRQCHPLDRR
jgi:DNA-binding MarR family transcriptional regulator